MGEDKRIEGLEKQIDKMGCHIAILYFIIFVFIMVFAFIFYNLMPMIQIFDKLQNISSLLGV